MNMKSAGESFNKIKDYICKRRGGSSSPMALGDSLRNNASKRNKLRKGYKQRMEQKVHDKYLGDRKKRKSLIYLLKIT